MKKSYTYKGLSVTLGEKCLVIRTDASRCAAREVAELRSWWSEFVPQGSCIIVASSSNRFEEGKK